MNLNISKNSKKLLKTVLTTVLSIFLIILVGYIIYLFYKYSTNVSENFADIINANDFYKFYEGSNSADSAITYSNEVNLIKINPANINITENFIWNYDIIGEYNDQYDKLNLTDKLNSFITITISYYYQDDTNLYGLENGSILLKHNLLNNNITYNSSGFGLYSVGDNPTENIKSLSINTYNNTSSEYLIINFNLQDVNNKIYKYEKRVQLLPNNKLQYYIVNSTIALLSIDNDQYTPMTNDEYLSFYKFIGFKNVFCKSVDTNNYIFSEGSGIISKLNVNNNNTDSNKLFYIQNKYITSTENSYIYFSLNSTLNSYDIGFLLYGVDSSVFIYIRVENNKIISVNSLNITSNETKIISNVIKEELTSSNIIFKLEKNNTSGNKISLITSTYENIISDVVVNYNNIKFEKIYCGLRISNTVTDGNYVLNNFLFTPDDISKLQTSIDPIVFNINPVTTSTPGNITSTQGNITSTQGNITSTQGNITSTQGNITSTQGNITTTTQENPTTTNKKLMFPQNKDIKSVFNPIMYI